MTNNNQRGAEGRPTVDSANPRPNNTTGHVIELTEDGEDTAATRFSWNIFMLAGNPSREDASKFPETLTYFAGYDKTKVSPIGAPDNLTFDSDGNMWIATDGAPSAVTYNDGLFAVAVEGANRGQVKQFFSAVQGAEVCGPEFTPDQTSLFAAIQHPAEGTGSTFELPLTRWPDNRRRIPPKPSLIVFTHDRGQKIGSAA
jgi:secreted PhoX family phosphatase